MVYLAGELEPEVRLETIVNRGILGLFRGAINGALDIINPLRASWPCVGKADQLAGGIYENR